MENDKEFQEIQKRVRYIKWHKYDFSILWIINNINEGEEWKKRWIK